MRRCCRTRRLPDRGDEREEPSLQELSFAALFGQIIALIAAESLAGQLRFSRTPCLCCRCVVDCAVAVTALRGAEGGACVRELVLSGTCEIGKS